MTILSTEPRGNGFLRPSETAVHATTVKSPSPYTNGSLTTVPRPGPSNLLPKFIEQFYELESYKYDDSFLLSCHVSRSFRNGKAVVVDGHSLSVPALVAAARHNAQIFLNGSTEIRARIQASRDVIMGKVESAKSVYGVSTGFGGSGKPIMVPPLLFQFLTHACLLQRILARLTLWLWEARCCNTNMLVSSLPPQMYSLPFPFLTPWRPPVCQSPGSAVLY